MAQNTSPTIRRFFRASLGFGILMGVIFPFYALIFARFDSVLALSLFSAGCLGAGFLVGFFAYWIGKKLLLDWIEVRSHGLGELGESGAVLDLAVSRQLGEISPNFTRFFNGLDRELRGIQKATDGTGQAVATLRATTLRTTQVMERLEASSTAGERSLQALSTEIQSATNLGQQLARSGTQMYRQIESEEKTFIELDECTRQVAQAQVTLSELTAMEFQRNRDLIERVRTGESSFVELRSLQERVGGVLQVLIGAVATMEEMAARANILSMNASIIAARAGVFGRGFAVVATEMRHQSDESARKAHDFKEKLSVVAHELDLGQASIEAAGQVFDDLKQSAHDSNEVLMTMDRTAEQFLCTGNSLHDQMERFSATFHRLKEVARTLEESGNSYQRLAHNEESENAQNNLRAILSESEALGENEESLSRVTEELFASVTELEALLARFRLLN